MTPEPYIIDSDYLTHEQCIEMTHEEESAYLEAMEQDYIENHGHEFEPHD